MQKCQRHVCSDYCLKTRKRFPAHEDNISRKRRVCRFGCGVEENPFKCDTPGFKNRAANSIVFDLRGFQRLELKRTNDQRFLQSSSYAVQSWRANCDIQILLYQSDPHYPDPSELATVTDYVVSYACKGNESISEEKQRFKTCLLSMHSLDNGVAPKTVATKTFNNSMKEIMISRQEASIPRGIMNYFTIQQPWTNSFT